MFDSVGDALDELWSLRKKKNESINEHIAKFKMLAAESKIDTTNPLSIELFKETLPWALMLQLMRLETPLKTIDDWYEWVASLDLRFHKVNQAIEQTRENSGKEKAPQRKYYSVTIANISRNSIYVPINIGSSKQTVKTLIDSSAGGLFIDQNFAKNFEINYLDEPVKAYNVDGTENKQGTINAYVNLKFKLGDWKFNKCFYVTGLRKQEIILGFPWLHKYNPIIDWKKGEITFKPFQINWKRLMEKGK
jgi:hypothetical protein